MAGPRSLCVVYDNIDDSGAIGRIATWAVDVGLEAGYSVTVVTDSLLPRLRGEVEAIPLQARGGVHIRRYVAASMRFREATADRSFDVTHVFQPQLAERADVWHVQFLVSAHLAKTPFTRSIRGNLARQQQRAVAAVERRAIRRITERTVVAFCSELLRDQFTNYHGKLERQAVLYNTSPTVKVQIPARERERPQGTDLVTVGFLGGADPRKGGRDLVAAAARDSSVYLVAGGVAGEIGGYALGPRFRSVGFVRDLDTFFGQIDVLAVPSRFEPFGLVVSEAISRGVPCLITPEVGAAELAVRSGAGAFWNTDESLSTAARQLLAGDVAGACQRYMRATSDAALRAQLLALWDA